MSNANTFFNFMQAWNSEIQTSQLRKLNDSLASNASSLSNLKASGGEIENRAAALKLAKDALFSAKKMIEEIEEKLEKDPEVSLFLYPKVIQGMIDLKETDFDDFADKEYFVTYEKRFFNCGEQLKDIYGSDLIDGMKNYRTMYQMHHTLYYLGAYKEYITYLEGNSYIGFFGINANKLREGSQAIEDKWGARDSASLFVKKVREKSKIICRNNLKSTINSLAEEVCKKDVFEWGDLHFWVGISPNDIPNYIEKLEQKGDIVIQGTRFCLGVEIYNPLGAGLGEKSISV